MKSKISVLSVEQKQYPARDGKEGAKYQICQCVVHDDTPVVGVLRVKNEMAEMKAGEYEAEFGLGISWDKKEIGGVLKALRPMSAARASA